MRSDTDYQVLTDYYSAVFEDKSISTLFDMYAFADDNELSIDGQELKRELLAILDKYSRLNGRNKK